MAVEWTDATRVRELIKSGSALTDAEIEDIIMMTEGYLKARYKIPSTFTFSESKTPHLILREAASLRAALFVLSTTPLSLRSLREVYLATNVYYQMLQENMTMLDNTDVFDYVEEQ